MNEARVDPSSRRRLPVRTASVVIQNSSSRGKRAVGITADAVFLVIPAGPDRKRQEAVAPLPYRHVARVGVRQRYLDDLPGDEGPVLVADLRVLEDRFRGVEDAVLRGREIRADDRKSRFSWSACASCDPRLSAFFEQVVDRLAEQFLDVGSLLECDLLELTGNGGVEETGDGLLASATWDTRRLSPGRRPPGAWLRFGVFRSLGGGLR